MPAQNYLKSPFRWAPREPKGQADWDLLFALSMTLVKLQSTKNVLEHDHLLMGAGLGTELVVWQNIFIRGEWGRAFRSANGISKGHNQFYFSSTIIF